MAKILVTGSEGTIGRLLMKRLWEEDHKVWGCDLKHSDFPLHIRADISDYRQAAEVFDYQDYDFVYHLAAEFGRKNGEEYYEQLWRTNAIGTKNILTLHEQDPFKLIFASSSEVYSGVDYAADRCYDDSLRLKDLKEDAPLGCLGVPLNDYALSKWVNEAQILNAEARQGPFCMRLRLFNAYGPGEYYTPYRSVVCQFVYRALLKLGYRVHEGWRDFMYIDDLIATLARLPENFRPGEVYNLGGNNYHSIRELSDLIVERLGGSPEYLPPEKHNCTHKRPSIEKAKHDLGHDPITPLEEGLDKTIAWMKEVYCG